MAKGFCLNMSRTCNKRKAAILDRIYHKFGTFWQTKIFERLIFADFHMNWQVSCKNTRMLEG